MLLEQHPRTNFLLPLLPCLLCIYIIIYFFSHPFWISACHVFKLERKEEEKEKHILNRTTTSPAITTKSDRTLFGYKIPFEWLREGGPFCAAGEKRNRRSTRAQAKNKLRSLYFTFLFFVAPIEILSRIRTPVLSNIDPHALALYFFSLFTEHLREPCVA